MSVSEVEGFPVTLLLVNVMNAKLGDTDKQQRCDVGHAENVMLVKFLYVAQKSK